MNDDLFDKIIKQKVQKIKENDFNIDKEIPPDIMVSMEELLDSLPEKKQKIKVLPIIRNSVVAVILIAIVYTSTSKTFSVFAEPRYTREELEDNWSLVVQNQSECENIKFVAAEVIGREDQLGLKYKIESSDKDITDKSINKEDITAYIDGKKMKVYKNDAVSLDGIIIGYIYIQMNENIEKGKTYNMEVDVKKINSIEGFWVFSSTIKIE